MMFAELLATEGVEEHCELRSSRVGFMAIHGGLEAVTFEIARSAAARSGASLYAVVQPDDLHWHVPSHRFENTASPNLRAFCEHVDVVISLHGYGGLRDSPQRWTTVVLGGGNRRVAGDLGALLRGALPDYTFIDHLDQIPSQYRGVHATNPVNCSRGGGVQIELPPRIRGNSPLWEGAARNASGFVANTETLIEALAAFASTLFA